VGERKKFGMPSKKYPFKKDRPVLSSTLAIGHSFRFNDAALMGMNIAHKIKCVSSPCIHVGLFQPQSHQVHASRADYGVKERGGISPDSLDSESKSGEAVDRKKVETSRVLPQLDDYATPLQQSNSKAVSQINAPRGY
jgi:hypothetical protein